MQRCIFLVEAEGLHPRTATTGDLGQHRAAPKVFSCLNSAGVGFELSGALRRRLFTEPPPRVRVSLG